MTCKSKQLQKHADPWLKTDYVPKGFVDGFRLTGETERRLAAVVAGLESSCYFSGYNLMKKYRLTKKEIPGCYAAKIKLFGLWDTELITGLKSLTKQAKSSKLKY